MVAISFLTVVPAMNNDPVSEPNRKTDSSPILGGRLFKNQILMVRGLRSRLMNLRNSRTADSETLAAERDRAKSQFVSSKSQLESQHAKGWRAAMTEWDSLLEKQFAAAERETLHNINQEWQQTKRLKNEFIQNKLSQKNKYDSASAELKQKKDEASLGRKNARDSIKAKLDRERSTIEQQMHECREWVGIRTGVAALQGLTSSCTPESAEAIQAITDLNHVGKRLEEIKQSLSLNISRMENHPISKMIGSTWFLGFGVLLGALAAVIAWALGAVPLLVGIVGIIGSILFTAVIHFATAPLVSRTIRRMFPHVVDQECLAYLVIAQGRRIADFNCQQEINRIEKQYVTGQQLLDTDHREKRTSLLSGFDATKKAVRQSSSEKRIVSMLFSLRRTH